MILCNIFILLSSYIFKWCNKSLLPFHLYLHLLHLINFFSWECGSNKFDTALWKLHSIILGLCITQEQRYLIADDIRLMICPHSRLSQIKIGIQSLIVINICCMRFFFGHSLTCTVFMSKQYMQRFFLFLFKNYNDIGTSFQHFSTHNLGYNIPQSCKREL